ncbi:hypothetical protein LMG19083_04864 [Ralstonia psammae]|uniref:DUF2827 domain-containing protein n=1 Tax=Ralstonia psammae TaxID=3058598 RepID=A0ABN9JEI0_9RALS|nr:DUF2827 domain-containing protein [Ralstonia sp. LMG 19083]CAJ0809162.1 hypothetical protein LMG19083_04864 [Ralstonia sp. LMG 19083]
MRIGISVLTHAGQSLWENGIYQNVLFLARGLRALPWVEEVVLLDCGDQAVLPADAAGLDFRVMAPRAATELIDVAIEMGGGLSIEWIDYLRARGKKVVFHCCGQPYVALLEPTVFGTSGYAARAQRCDEVWILPKDRAFMPMLRTLHRCPVIEVPYLWEPVFLQQRIAALAEHGVRFGYEAEHRPTGGPRALRVGVFEPNISVVKTCTVPTLIADAAYRAQPESVAALHVLNSVQMQTHPTFRFLIDSLELTRAGKTVLEQRHDFVGYTGQHIDAVVSHQWQNPQNYLYLDALYGGYPLVHNSPWLEAGYAYPEFDIRAGAMCLIQAAHGHDANLRTYRAQAQAFLARLSPLAPANGSAYARRLLALTSARVEATA